MRSKGVLHHDTEILVPFFDVDSMHVVWHGHYVKYLEIARCALLDSLGHNYKAMQESGYAWPVIDLQLRYVRGAVFGQRLNVRASLVEWENRLKINYLISDLASGDRLHSSSQMNRRFMTVSSRPLRQTPVAMPAASRE